MKRKKIVLIAVAINVVLFIVGTVAILRNNKMKREETQYVAASGRLITGLTKLNPTVPKQDIADATLTIYRISVGHPPSDRDFDKLINVLESCFRANKTGDILFNLGYGFGYGNRLSNRQRHKVGDLCMNFLQNATKNRTKAFALLIIKQMEMPELNSKIMPYINNPDPKIASVAQSIISGK